MADPYKQRPPATKKSMREKMGAEKAMDANMQAGAKRHSGITGQPKKKPVVKLQDGGMVGDAAKGLRGRHAKIAAAENAALGTGKSAAPVKAAPPATGGGGDLGIHPKHAENRAKKIARQKAQDRADIAAMGKS